MRFFLLALAVVAACGDSSPSNPSGGSSGVPNTNPPPNSSSSGTSASMRDGGSDDDDAAAPPGGSANVRIMAANITSGNFQSYDPGHGTRIFQGLKPDIVLIQEFKFGDNTDAALAGWVSSTFGDSFKYFRETGFNIPNGVVSRYPIVQSGQFDSKAPDRSFAWAKIAVPGTHSLYAFSVHLLTANATTRNAEAEILVARIKQMVSPGDYVVIGGDFNTGRQSETCMTTFDELVDATTSRTVDGAGNANTNSPRNRPLDWVLVSPDLAAKQIPVVVGANRFPNGFVFDSRVYTPLSDVAPVQADDSAVFGMQHMAVIRDFHLD